MDAEQENTSSLLAAGAGLRALRHAPRRTWLCLVPLLLLFLVMVPVGRTGGGGLLIPLSVDGFQFRERQGIDFFSVYDAGARLLAGEPLYAWPAGEGFRAPYQTLYRYPPLTGFWLAVPLNVLPPWPAYACWVAVLYILVIANFLLCVGRRPEYLLPFAVVWFAWFPVIVELHMGQFTLFMATLLLWGIDGLRSGRAAGGLGWTLAVLLKVYPLAMAPSLFLWGWRKLSIAAVVILVGSTLLLTAAIKEPGFAEGVGRTIGGMRTPYAGAQGTQEAVTAVVWKFTGRSFGGDPAFQSPPALRDPALVVNVLILAVYAIICAWALWRTRHHFSLAAIGLFWMTWFVAFRDCWEHHYVLMQALIGLLAAWRVIDWRTMLLCWLFAGTPSLWWFWQRSGYAGNLLAEIFGLFYFLQRPAAVVLLTIILLRAIRLNSDRPHQSTIHQPIPSV